MKQRSAFWTLAVVLAAMLAVVVYIAIGSNEKQKPLPKPKPVAKLVTLVKAKKDTVPEKPVPKKRIISGEVTDENDQPLHGVVVSDGYSCTKTNFLGHYTLEPAKDARYVFVSVPDYCEVPTHSPDDRTAMFYHSLANKLSTYNFTLHRLPGGKETSFELLVFGDPQITNAALPYYTDATDSLVDKSNIDRFTEETMSDVRQTLASRLPALPVYGISMGDNVQYYGGYNPAMEMQMREALGSTEMPVFSVIGNHDQDGKTLYERKWEECWGPTDYSFDRGDIHFVCFNNVHFYRGSYWQPGELTARQLAWLKADLSLADKHKKVIFCYHIPLTMGTHPIRGAQSLDLPSEPGHYKSTVLGQILQLAADFEGGVELFCGHTHFALNHDIFTEGIHVLEHCHAAACGMIWQSNINICGTPNGYYVYSISGTKLTNCYFKGTRLSRKRQMTLFYADTDFNGESYSADWSLPRDSGVLVANVFNADYRWQVVAVEDGVEHEMHRISATGQDAFAAGYLHKYLVSASSLFVGKQNPYLIMNHLYYYVPHNPEAAITVRARDPYGNVYTEESRNAISEPFFNFAHYYNQLHWD